MSKTGFLLMLLAALLAWVLWPLNGAGTKGPRAAPVTAKVLLRA